MRSTPDKASRMTIDNTPSTAGTRTVEVQGSKNCFNHMAVVSLLGGKGYEMSMSNAPDISDVRTVRAIFRSVGLSADLTDDTFTVAGQVTSATLDAAHVRRLRVSICYGAAIAAVHGACWMPFPGGDAFTRRPIDLHLSVLRAAGARVEVRPHGIWIEFIGRPRSFDVDIAGPFGPSMGASVTALAVAAVAHGRSMIRSLSREPEVEQVKEALRLSGVSVEDVDPGICRVTGVAGRLAGKVSRKVPADRIEAATYIFLAAARNTALRLDGIGSHDLPLGFRRAIGEIGIRMERRDDDGCVVVRGSTLRAVDLETSPHPGFPTDAQPQLAALMGFAAGRSTITESVYSQRTTHVAELRKLNVHIDVAGSRQVIPGEQLARSGSANVRDIRCGAALLVAAATVPGRTVLLDPQRHLWRGYSHLETKLRAVGMTAGWAA
ncbi:UDP-N-acetylglucosamine 1-carboxyvinyltransferase [Actinoallomurus acanthiterrae]